MPISNSFIIQLEKIVGYTKKLRCFASFDFHHLSVWLSPLHPSRDMFPASFSLLSTPLFQATVNAAITVNFAEDVDPAHAMQWVKRYRGFPAEITSTSTVFSSTRDDLAYALGGQQTSGAVGDWSVAG